MKAELSINTQIFSGQAGGHLAGLGPLIGEVLGTKAAPVEFHAAGKRRSMRVGNISAAEIEALAGQGTDDVMVDRPPFAAVPGVSFVVVKSKANRFNDYRLNWELSDKNGFFSRFTYQSS